MEIKIKKKYILYKFLNNKISKLTEAQTKTELKENIKGKKINDESDIILITFEKTDWTQKTKIPINMLGGPIKVLFSFYTISKKGVLKKNKEDPRAIQFLFYTYEYYLKHKINSKDLKKLALFAQANKLEKRPLAPKLITQLN
jgi:hypothetical protein